MSGYHGELPDWLQDTIVDLKAQANAQRAALHYSGRVIQAARGAVQRIIDSGLSCDEFDALIDALNDYENLVDLPDERDRL